MGIGCRHTLAASALVAIILFVADASATAQDAASFYKDKVITLIVGYGPGGGYDSYARLLAPHLEKAIGVTVVVSNRPGGGGAVALNQLYQAEPDGLTIMLVNGKGALLGQLTEKEGVRYDLVKLSWLARVATHTRMWLMNGESPLGSVQDVLDSTAPVKFAASGKTDGMSDSAAIICRALGIQCKLVIGYKNSKESALAVIRGEVESLVVSDSSATKYTKAGDLVAIAAIGRDRSRFFPDVPTIFEQVALTDDQAWWLDYYQKISGIGRVLVAPPAVPEDRIAFLRWAFDGILSDPAVIAEGKAVKRYILHAPGAEAEGLVVDLLQATPPHMMAEVRRVFLETYF